MGFRSTVSGGERFGLQSEGMATAMPFLSFGKGKMLCLHLKQFGQTIF